MSDACPYEGSGGGSDCLICLVSAAADGLLVYWSTGLQVCLVSAAADGLLVFRSSGLLVYWSVRSDRWIVIN